MFTGLFLLYKGIGGAAVDKGRKKVFPSLELYNSLDEELFLIYNRLLAGGAH